MKFYRVVVEWYNDFTDHMVTSYLVVTGNTYHEAVNMIEQGMNTIPESISIEQLPDEYALEVSRNTYDNLVENIDD